MFGSAVGTPDNDYEIHEGWFTNVTSLYDPDNTFITGSPDLQPGHNAFGFIGPTQRITRLGTALNEPGFVCLLLSIFFPKMSIKNSNTL